MSLDISIIYPKPKLRIIEGGLDGVACGSTLPYYDQPGEIYEKEWSANVTHNMGKMAMQIPVNYKQSDGEEYSNTLYDLVWTPEEWNCANTDIVALALQSGISYMVAHRDELLQYNPPSGWGDYNSFLEWLVAYWRACLENPNCKIKTWR